MKKYEVHWVHYQLDKETVHGQYSSLDKAIESVYDWWNIHDYVPDYVRQWTVTGVTTLDYGFHHMFYKIHEIEVQEDTEMSLTPPIINFTVEEGSMVPMRGRENDIAHDIYTNESAFVLPNNPKATIVGTGIRTAFDPKQYGLFISPRSGITKYPLTLANNTGIIEGEYRGEIGIPFKNTYTPPVLGALTSKYVLTIGRNGALESVPVETMFQSDTIKAKYMEAITEWLANQKLVYGMTRDLSVIKRELASVDTDRVLAGTIYIPKATRLMQAYLVKRYDPIFYEVDSLSETTRGDGGYGSSGVN